MKKIKLIVVLSWLILISDFAYCQQTGHSFIDAADYGFSPEASGVDNVKALQAAVDHGGTITVSKPGVYKVSGTTYIGDNTSLVFGNGVVIKKSAENGRFTHVLINKGALSRTYNHSITITGLTLDVNGVDKPMDAIYGLRGHIAFFYVKDLKIERLRCTGLVNGQFCLHTLGGQYGRYLAVLP